MISEFVRGESIRQVLTTLQRGKNSSGVIAGGTEIMRLGSRADYTNLVSLQNLGLDTIKKVNGVVHIGAMTTFTTIRHSEVVPSYLREAAGFCASFAKANMATIGGNVANLRDDSYLLPTLIAAKARLIIADISVDGTYNEENIPLREYHEFMDHFSDSLILAVELNRKDRVVLNQRFSRTAHGNAAITLAFGAQIEEGTLKEVRIAAAVKGTGIIRLKGVEEGIMDGQFLEPEDAAMMVGSEVAFTSDVTGSASYKKYLLSSSVADLYRKGLALAEKGGKA
ncbi:MAG: FAD binding domain-containing protein [Sphaerochaetaceae bacterium]|nr:FAD binding domain-containing protein [Sphaerochaetaceae bacterium]